LDGKISVTRINTQFPVCVHLDTAKKWGKLGIGEILGPVIIEGPVNPEEKQGEIMPEIEPEMFMKNKLEAIPVSGKISMLIGLDQSVEGNVGGNIGVSAGPDGLLIIDDGMEFALDDIKEKLVELRTCISCDNVEFLLNTHWHFDHVSNNAYFGEHDTTIVAHSNVRELLSSPQEQKAFGIKFDAYPKEALPIITFDDSVFLYFNDEKIQVNYLPNGHTDSDSVVYFTESNVLHLGDHFFNGMFPFVDLEHGGSVQGLTKNIESIINEYPEDVKIIPGHGPLSNMDDLVEYHIMLVETTKIIQNQMDAGTSLEEIQNLGLPERWQKWEGAWIDEATWIMIVHTSLSQS
jgi:glyoxylase-like metal-dependent hydrolase (beta-lactamase superfamily II)